MMISTRFNSKNNYSNSIVGTIAYLAPEIFNGEHG